MTEVPQRQWCASCHGYTLDCRPILTSNGRKQMRCLNCRTRQAPRKYAHIPKPRHDQP